MNQGRSFQLNNFVNKQKDLKQLFCKVSLHLVQLASDQYTSINKKLPEKVYTIMLIVLTWDILDLHNQQTFIQTKFANIIRQTFEYMHAIIKIHISLEIPDNLVTWYIISSKIDSQL